MRSRFDCTWLGVVMTQASKSSMVADDYTLEMTSKDIPALEAAKSVIPRETRISVTFLPGETMEGRVAAAVAIRKSGFIPVPHFSARRIASEREFEEFLSALVLQAKVNSAFVVAGDPSVPVGPYHDAQSLIASGVMSRHGIQRVGIAGYPDGHPEIATPQLWDSLVAKNAAIVAAGQTPIIVTQFGFDPDPVRKWLEELRKRGVDALVRVGVPGPTSVASLLRFAARCGVSTSAKVLSKYGLSATRLLGSAGPDVLIRSLAEGLDPAVHGDVRIHFYPFGGLAKSAEWASRFRL